MRQIGIGCDRRSLLAASSALLGGALLAGTARAARPGGATLGGMDPLELFVRLRCTGFKRTAWWWYSGTLLADKEGEPLRPVLSVQGAAETRAAQQADGNILYSMTEAGYYGDLANGRIVDGEVTNPLTGKPITPQPYLSPQQLLFTPELTVEPVAKLPPGSTFDGIVTAPDIKGGRIWMAEELLVKVPRGSRPPLVANSLANFEAAIGDVLGPREFVPTSMQYTTFNSYRPWMDMGDVQGHVVMRVNGIKLDSWQRVPAPLRHRIESDHPGVFGK